MKAVAAVVVAALVLAVAIAAFAPATLADARLAALSGGALRLAAAQGTIWHGRGALTPADGRWRIPIEWRLDAPALLRGAASVTFVAADDIAYGVRGRVHSDGNRASAESLLVRMPAAAAASLPLAIAVEAGGELHVRADGVSWGATGSSGQVEAEWRRARLVYATLPALSLGTITARLAARGDTLAGPVTSQGGDVRASGTVALGPTVIDVDLRLQPEATAAPDVRKALAALGPIDATGAVAVRAGRAR